MMRPSHLDNLFGQQFIQTQNIPLAEIGTDTNTADFIYTPFYAKTGALAPLFGGQAVMPASIMQSAVVGLTVKNLFVTLGLTEMEQAAFSGFRIYAEGKEPSANVPGYKARPLNGIWATSPYLHNGSVRTLSELLKPVAEREETFWIGSRKFDPETVGFASYPALGHQLFDTTQPGNLATGHDYGTQLPDEEKIQLLAFLRSL